jgi:hypothetical protein
MLSLTLAQNSLFTFFHFTCLLYLLYKDTLDEKEYFLDYVIFTQIINFLFSKHEQAESFFN